MARLGKNVAFLILVTFVLVTLSFWQLVCYTHETMGSVLASNAAHMNRLYDDVHDMPNYYMTVNSACLECEVYDLSRDSSGLHYPCVQMNITPSTTICLYPEGDDNYVSGAFYRNTIWEKDMVQKVQAFLVAHPDCGLIDIGANIGTYSLLTAAMGRNVLAVEPNIENVRRIHQAVTLSGSIDHITLLVNSMSNKRGVTKLVLNKPRNIGAMSVEQVNIQYETNNISKDYIKSITMNDLLPFCKFKMAVMKIDIEGFEHRALGNAGDLFDKIDIPLVKMEWAHMKDKDFEDMDAEDRALFSHMMSFFVERNYSPQSMRGQTLDVEDWNNWPWDIDWVKQYI